MSPNIISATALPVSSPRYQHSTMAGALLDNSLIVMGRPLTSRTTVGLPVFRIASASFSCRPTRSRLSRSPRWLALQASRQISSFSPMTRTTASLRFAVRTASAIRRSSVFGSPMTGFSFTCQCQALLSVNAHPFA